MKISRKSRKTRISMTLASDVAFLLLIFVMFITLALYEQTVDIKIPQAVNVESLDTEALMIWIGSRAEITVDGSLLTLDEVDELLLQLLKDSPDLYVTLLADYDLEYKSLDAILARLKKHSIKSLSFNLLEVSGGQ